MKKLSIITINLNNSIGLEKTINSIKNQVYKNFEFIIIDGGSNDNSIELIKNNESIINYWISEPDFGIYNAMNKGLKIAKGEFCLFINSGDYLFSELSLKKIFEQDPKEDIVCCNLEIKDGLKSKITIFPDVITFYWIFTEFIGHPSTLIKRSLFEIVGNYNEKYKIVSDWEFFVIALAKYQVSYKHYNITLSTLTFGGISTNQSSVKLVQEERSKVMNEHFKLFESNYKEYYDLKHNNFKKKIKRFIKKWFLIQ